MSKKVLITGSTDGIGKIAATRMAKDGHHVIIHGRNNDKISTTISEIQHKTGNINVEGVQADLSRISEVTAMSRAVEEKVDVLDVLINNAGVFKSSLTKNEVGLDLRMLVNYLSPYLLTQKLIPLLEKSSGARLINLSSAAQATVSMDVLKGIKEVSQQESYAQSKLALTMWSFHLANKMPNISVIAVNPGSLLNTRMVQEAYGTSWSSADKGGNILYELATLAIYDQVSGKYFDNDKGDPRGSFGTAHRDAYDPDLINQLIENTEAILESYGY